MSVTVSPSAPTPPRRCPVNVHTDKPSIQELYRGHRPASLIVDDVDERTEWRARQRTHDGAYLRTALLCSTYALMILKLFSREFDKVGLTYAILALVLLVVSFLRRKRLNEDFLDKYLPTTLDPITGEQTNRIWGRQFRTSGDIVILLSTCVLAIQISLVVLLWKV
ncbi:hypothetical protein CROQUDRAFT_651358 [Cronartium quercuum f. sp. fusiforme G11]|uniref:DUF202 domain-containing protein n=1 Tax=Cronartium quercuum f. sp. fusiforme G11 TaxID=708437 RepID=A0A9P6NVI2_9BASI|nr:hypothetical protein CROQUDRAFT_651358 [Cronartium quercuum f. sp. fusiforme G11]